MNLEFPKLIFRPGMEPQVNKINRCTILTKLKKALPVEYEEVMGDPVFGQILAIHKNCLGYSARLIHIFMCKQLITAKKHELWFVFARRPLRFSLQEFYAKKWKDDDSCGFEKWKDDKGFWSHLLKSNGNISIHMIIHQHIQGVNTWSRKDRLRLVYLCVIAGVLLAKNEKVHIPHTYIKVVMDIDKLRKYPWGLKSFQHQVESIIKARKDLTKTESYVLDGFSYAFHIWIMEAIPDFGTLLGKRVHNEITYVPRCFNWTGAAKVTYAEIIQLESAFGSECIMYPYISSTGNFDVFESSEFSWADEMSDDRVDLINQIIRGKNDWSNHMWENEESVDTSLHLDEQEEAEIEESVNTPNVEDKSVSATRRGKKKFPDSGAETRKHKLLCQRSAEKYGRFDEDMKSFIQGLMESSFTSLEEKLGKKIEDRLGKLEKEFTQFKDSLTQAAFTSNDGDPSSCANPASINHSQPKRTVSKKKKL